jgi:hypothetical protein
MGELKNRIRLGNSTLDTKLFSYLNELSNQTKIIRSTLLDEAVKDLLSKYEMQGKYLPPTTLYTTNPPITE